jgi:type IX secretion system PorP/SprF family membrane protein
MVKILIRSFYVLFAVLFTPILHAQGVHFSYIDFAPQHVNPGNIGGFLGSYRAAGIYRDQYNNGSVSGYKTFELGLDLPVIRGFRKQDWIGAGISLNSDTRGTLKLKDVYSRIGLSYHFGLDAKQISSISLGVQMISINRSINTNFAEVVSPEGYKTGKDLELTKLLQGADPKGLKSLTARDWNVGLVYSRNTKANALKLGVSTSGLLPSELGFTTSVDTASVPFKLVGFASLVNQFSKTMTLEPTAFFQITEYGGREFLFSTKVGYQLNAEKKDKVKAGLGFRTGSFSAIFFAGAEIKGINFGLSYDLPLSGYSGAPGTQNGFEFGASYIGLFKKTPKQKPLIICPRL